MAGRNQRQKLWSEGAQTEGVVMKLHWHSRLQGTYGVEFRVKFPDGSTADVAERFLDASNQGYVSEGDVVPVRYDPAGFSKVRLDVPALEAPLKQAKAAQGARREAALAQLGEPGAAAAGVSSGRPAAVVNLSALAAQSGSNPEDRLEKLAEPKERGILSDEDSRPRRPRSSARAERPSRDPGERAR